MTTENEHAAQQAAEHRLEEYLSDENGLCECYTCLVREVLEAAWPHLRATALQDAADELTQVVRAYGNHADRSRFARQLGLLGRRWLGRE